jgi:hypothetical protein
MVLAICRFQIVVDAMTDRTGPGAFETQAAFARRIGVTRQRVGAMVKAGCPIGDDGLIHVAVAEAWVDANIEARNRSAANSAKKRAGTVDLTEARRLKILADTDLTRLSIAKDSGELVNKEEVRRALAAFSRLIRDKWVNFANRYGLQIAGAVGAEPKALMAELEKAVRLQLDEISSTRPTLP